jgi:hypothetical protein
MDDFINISNDVVDFHVAWIAKLYNSSFDKTLNMVNNVNFSGRSLQAAEQMTVQESTVIVNIILFLVLFLIYELVRRIHRIYLCRRTVAKVKQGRVPPSPLSYPFSWLFLTYQVEDDEFLRMAGLDAYMMIRFLKVCIRISLVYTTCGLIILAPVYYTGIGENDDTWTKYTIANVGNLSGTVEQSPSTAARFWVPVILSYLFAATFCNFFGSEYRHFLERRVEYFETGGDPSTPLQTYYTVMLDYIPEGLRSQTALEKFFEDVLPNQVYSVEMTYDLQELDAACEKRRIAQEKLEDSIAYWRGEILDDNDERLMTRVWPWMTKQTLVPMTENKIFGITVFEYDTIDYWASELTRLNEEVLRLQLDHYSNIAVSDSQEVAEDTHGLLSSIEKKFQNALSGLKLPRSVIDSKFTLFKDALSRRSSQLNRDSELSTGSNTGTGISRTEGVPIVTTATFGSDSSYNKLGKMEISVSGSIPESGSNMSIDDNNSSSHSDSPLHPTQSEKTTEAEFHSALGGESSEDESNFSDVNSPDKPSDEDSSAHGLGEIFLGVGQGIGNVVGKIGHVGADIATAGMKAGVHMASAGVKESGHALGGVFRGVHQGLRSLELLTIGSYKTSSTAFVTFKTRVACSMAYQMFLSTDHYTMKVSPAPQPGDIQWNNVAIAQHQVETRKTVANIIFYIGALFWSVVVAGISTISDLDNLAKRYTWIQSYQDTYFYEIMSDYLASLLLVIALALLPIFFDFSARTYEGIKLESRIQDSVLSRYFAYQVVNVIISVGLGSVLTNLNDIIEQPTKILEILGQKIPSFSAYFANLLIVKTFTALPIEMLRIWPLIQVGSLACTINEKRCSWRYLHTGIFATPEFTYAWYYPSMLMVLMIINIYALISPLILPFALLYFVFIFFLYKYQLLYVFQNNYQAGGMMWEYVFRYSMMTLIIGTLSVVCYFGIRIIEATSGAPTQSGPLYALLPLPILTYLYWGHCETSYAGPSKQMSLAGSVQIDEEHRRYEEEKEKNDKLLSKKRLPLKTNVTVNYKNNGEWLHGKIKVINDNGTYCIEYNNGKIEDYVIDSNIKIQKAHYRRAKQIIKFDDNTNTFNRTNIILRDSITNLDDDYSEEIPIESFQEQMFVQPSLLEGKCQPLPYRQIVDTTTYTRRNRVYTAELMPSPSQSTRNGGNVSCADDANLSSVQVPILQNEISIGGTTSSSDELRKDTEKDDSSGNTKSSSTRERGISSLKMTISERYIIDDTFFKNEHEILQDVEEDKPVGEELDFISDGSKWNAFNEEKTNQDQDNSSEV